MGSYSTPPLLPVILLPQYTLSALYPRILGGISFNHREKEYNHSLSSRSISNHSSMPLRRKLFVKLFLTTWAPNYWHFLSVEWKKKRPNIGRYSYENKKNIDLLFVHAKWVWNKSFWHGGKRLRDSAWTQCYSRISLHFLLAINPIK